MRRIHVLIPTLVIASILRLTAGCASEDAAATSNARSAGRAGGGGAAAVPVTVAAVVQKSVPIEVAVIGAAEPFSTVAIRSQITGQLNRVNFTEGDDVKAGQVLFTLDRRPLEAGLGQARARSEERGVG